MATSALTNQSCIFMAARSWAALIVSATISCNMSSMCLCVCGSILAKIAMHASVSVCAFARCDAFVALWLLCVCGVLLLKSAVRKLHTFTHPGYNAITFGHHDVQAIEAERHKYYKGPIKSTWLGRRA